MSTIHNITCRHGAIAAAIAGMAFSYPDLHAVDPAKCLDITAAKEYCDSHIIEEPEGIWVYPDDNVTILIAKKPFKSPTSLQSYSMTVVVSTDTQLLPGEQLGTLEECPVKGQYKMTLLTERKEGILSEPKSCLATLSSDGEAMTVEKEKQKFSFRFSFTPTLLLPSFWRMVRVTTKENNNSTAHPKSGMKKTYPSYDGNGSSRRKPRYL